MLISHHKVGQMVSLIRVLHTVLEVLSVPLRASDNNQVRRALADHLEDAGDRARQSEHLQEKHGVFQKAIGRATESYQSEVTLGKKGCQLAFLAQWVREHYIDKEKRSNNISTRLIGKQAISLSRYSHRLIDALDMEDESRPQKIQQLAPEKMAQCLRDAGNLSTR